MKVLFITNIPAPYRVEFFNELSRYCELTVLFERSDANNRNSGWLKKEDIHFKAVFLKALKIGSDSSLCIDVIKYLNYDDFDIIIVGGYSTPTGMLAISYMKYKKIPFVLSVDGGLIKSESKSRRKLKKFFIGSAEAWLSTSKQTKDYLIHYGANQDKVYMYPFTSLSKEDILTGIVSDEKKRIIKNNLGIKHSKVIISVGQFIDRKGFDILLNACRYLDDDVAVYIIGGKPPSMYLDLVNRYHLKNIYFEGFKSKEELKQYYLAADLFVLPTREDIWGLVINEAMAYGLPIITTNRCGAGLELIKNDENGYIVPVEADKELANRMNELLNNKELRLRMQKNNLKKIREYSIENMARRHIDILNRCMKTI